VNSTKEKGNTMTKWKHDKTFHTFKKEDDGWSWVIGIIIGLIILGAIIG